MTHVMYCRGIRSIFLKRRCDMAMKLKATIDPNPVDALVQDDEIGAALIHKAIEICGISHTFRFNYVYTDETGNTYVQGSERISLNPDVAALVDAGNYLMYGFIAHSKDDIEWLIGEVERLRR